MQDQDGQNNNTKRLLFLIKIIHKRTGIPEHRILLCLKKPPLDSNIFELGDEFVKNTSKLLLKIYQNLPFMLS